MKEKMFILMDWIAHWWGQYGCSSTSTKVLYDPRNLKL